ncbi:MAG TPA: MBL fold metallo-hydrolase, partial [Pirellulaceae bacterium]|nr:MBL fold metallo-hydrolase [Pirellulaceae bacterium]
VVVGYACSVRSPLWSVADSQPELTTTFVSVGHGTSVLCEFKNGRTLLYDAGHMGAPGGAANSISAVLWSRGITKLDAVVLSHADADHYNALPELLKRFDVEVIYTSPLMFAELPPGVQALHDAITKHAVPIKIVHHGSQLSLGEGINAEVLHPPAQDFIGSDNASSIVLALTVQNQRVLLPGDLETTGLLDVFRTKLLPCAVVMAPHHGSVRSNPRGFAAWSKPAWVVISGSRSRDATEVVDAYRSAGADVLQTAHDGAIRFVMHQGKMRVETWEADHWLERRHHAAR